ncbi:hypothetical protein GWI33_000645 [Rhynchophorus ferrugineus]|uniref:Uncharacterized protein n=1 Tax=Rhynchophorus ferrugineus TaxID=354439 RepID=A0A834IPB4_RHYFE|nr:hypothetical protein GWI33_000645 [Rhynchophorus ferrugineus]
MNMVHYMSGADVTFQVYGPKKEEKKVKNVLNKWIDRGYIGNVTVSEKDNSIKTVLSIQSVDINQAGVIRENDEFILSCVARGSPSMTFRWFKDGLFMNLTYAKQKWIKLIKDPHVTDQYTALLAVERAQKYDEGKFTCQVEDFNIQQCMSKFVKVKRRPLVKIEPMSLTVKKGQSFTVKCVTMEENGGIGGKYTYSWTKNKELLPVRTEYEKYETLYPAGTILQVFRVEKDVTYSCLVQDSITSSEKVIHVHVLDREGVHTCPNETSYDLIWPETAPDTDYVQECPKDFSGTVVRKCLLRDGRIPAWEKPDFSHCTYKTLGEVYDDFQQLKLGYAATSIDTLSEAFLEYVTVTQRGNLRPGEGARILTLVQEAQTFISQIKMSYATTGNITSRFYKVIDRVCSIPEALLRPQEVNLLQQVLFTQLKLSEFQLEEELGMKFFNVNLNTIDVTVFQQGPKQNIFRVPISIKKIPKETWVSVKITHQKEGKENELFGNIIYRNLSMFFPPKSFLRIKDGTEIQYQIFSQITTLRPISQNASGSSEAAVAIDFRHGSDTSATNATSADKWEIRCGYTDAKSLAYSWDIYRCQTKNVDASVTRCLCPSYGSYVLLLILTQPEVTETPAEPHKFILICSFCVSIILTLVSTVCLGLSFALSKRSCLIVLKIQCSMSLFLCEMLFIIAIVTEPPQEYYMVFLTFLEMFLLLSISSHLSKLLIIFTELIQVPKPMTSKYTVVGIISGVPIITIFGNHLAYKTMDIDLKSWWMRENSLAFNIFIVVVSIITALFIFIYLSVVKKLRELMTSQEKHEKVIKRRISLIRRAGCIFFVLIGFSISSIVYINNEKIMWSTYQFGAVNFVLGVVVTLCYIVKSEIGIRDIFIKEKRHSDGFFGVETAGPLQFMTKADAEMENQSGLRKQDIQQISLKTMEPLKVSVSRTQSISNAFESCLQSSSNFCDVSVKETSTLRRDKSQHQIEPYSSSPPTFRKLQSNNTFSQSPDILSQKVCVELDLVASSICTSNPDIQIPKETVLKTEKKSEHKTVRIMFPPKVIITPDDAISRILDGDNSDSERTQPDGHDEIIASSEQTSSACSNPSSPQHTSFPDDHLDGVLDSISHDLDYLLNRSDDVDSGLKTSTLNRKISKPPGANVVHKLPDELLQDESVGPEGIMLRTNC